MQSEAMKHTSSQKWIKYFSLVFLTLQTTCLVISMRVSRIPSNGSLYLTSTIVVCAEVSKLIVCLIMVLISQGTLRSALNLLYVELVVEYKSTLMILVPSALYTLQNNLLYVAISNLNAVAYQILYQSKIFTTAFFMILLMNRRLFLTQWLALSMLTLGIILSQLKSTGTKTSTGISIYSTAVGILAIVCASFSSGFAGVYYEKILKGTQPSIWMRNIQLALFGIPIGLCGVFMYDGRAVLYEGGFFQGYTWLTWLIVLLQTSSGLGVAFVIKYADNILKGFAAGLSIVLSSIVSYLILDDFTPTIQSFMGACMVIGATVLYGYTPDKPKLHADKEVV